jgi:hypothetical protein
MNVRNRPAAAVMIAPTTAALFYRIHVEEATLHQALIREH